MTNQHLQAKEQDLIAANQQLKANEQQLKAVNEQLESILESINDGFFVLETKDLIVKYFNKAAEELLQRKANDVLGKPLFDAFPEAKNSIFETNYRKAFNEQISLKFETYFGIEPYINWYNVNVYYNKNRITVIFQVITEIKKVQFELQAANQQLSASEKELRAGNQQLSAMNQQLAANEQQLRAANQQLQSSEQQLEASEKKNRSILDNSPFPVAVVDVKDENIFFWSKSALDMFGHDPKTTEEWYELAYPDPNYRDEVIERWKPYLKKAEKSDQAVYTGEYNITCKDGSVKRCEIYAQFISEILIVTLNDITARKKAEEGLKESQQRFDYAMKASQDGIWDWNISENKVFYSQAWQNILNIDEESNSFDLWNKRIHQEDKDEVMKSLNLHLENKTDFWEADHRLRAGDGKWKWVKGKGKVMEWDSKKNPTRMVGTMTDITELKKVEEELKESEERLNLIIKGSNDAPWDWDLVKDDLYYSPQWWAQIGYEPDEIAKDSQLWARLRHPDDVERVDNFFADALKNKDSYEVEFKLKHKDGHYVPILSRGFISRNNNGEPIRVSGTNLDLTERKKAEEQLKESEEKYRKLFENSVAPILNTLTDGTIEAANPASEVFFGVGRNELTGANLLDFYANPAYRMEFRRAMDEKGSVTDFPIQFKKKDGTLIDCLATVSVHRSEDGSEILGYRGTLRDVTDQKRAEEAIIAAKEKAEDNERKLSAIFNHRFQLTGMLDTNGKLLSANRMALEFANAEESDVVGKYFWDGPWWTSDQEQQLKEAIKKASNGLFVRYETTCPTPSGELRDFDFSLNPVKNEEGKVIYIIPEGRDITEQKQAEELLENERKRFYILLETFPGFIYLQSPDYTIKYANKYFIDIFGEYKNGLCHDIICKSKKPCVPCPTFEVFETKKSKTWEWNDPATSKVYMIYDHPFIDSDGTELVLEIGIDITERKKAVDALIQSERRYDLTMQAINDGMWDWDIAGNNIYFDDRYYTMAGYKPLEFPSAFEEWQKRVHPDDIESTLKEIDRHVKKETKVFDLTFRFLKKDGNWMWIRGRGKIVEHDRDGNPLRMVGTHTDVTSQKEMDQKLKESEESLRDAQRIANIGNWFFDLETGKVEISDQLLYIIGLKDKSEASDVSAHEKYYTPESWKRYAQALDTIINKGKSVEVELEFSDLNPNYRYAISTGEPIFDENNKVVQVKGTLQDITERKQSENELLETRERLQFALEGSQQGMWDWTIPSGETIYNDQWANLFGYKQDEVEPTVDFFLSHVHPKDLETVKKRLQLHLDQKAPIYESEHRMLRKDGKVIWTLDRGKVTERDHDGKPLRATGLITDISKVKQTEEELKKSANFTKALLNAQPTAVFYKDLEGRYLGCNQTFTEIMGVSSDEIKGKTVYELWPSEHAEMYHNKDLELMQKPEHQKYEFVIKDKDDNIRPVIYAKDVFFDEKGDVAGIVGAFLDISERKKAEGELKKNQRELKELVMNSPVCINRIDLDFNLQFMSDPGISQLKIDDIDQFYNKPYPLHFFPEKFKEDMSAKMEEAKQTGETLEIEGELSDTKGNRLWYHHIIAPVKDEKGKLEYLLIVSMDINERKAAEAESKKLHSQLAQSQKMEAVGTLAGGIAHDFNNILGVIIGYTDLILEDPSDPQDVAYNISQVMKASERAKDMVQQILMLSRKQEDTMGPVRIEKIVGEVCKFLKNAIPSTIVIQVEIEGQISSIHGNATQINQVLLNLATNASYAMQENGGMLTIGLKQISIDSDRGKALGVVEGQYIKLSVFDTGCGINPAHISRIFEPYFTTKPEGEGTGLGLSVIYSIVQNHSGSIQVYSEPGNGTRFDLYFPAITDVEVSKRLRKKTRLLDGSGKYVLLLDDEQGIVEFTKKVLESFGFNVAFRNNGSDGFAAFQQAPDKYDLIITDMTMPHMTGLEMAEKINKIKPDIPIILCTGFRKGFSKSVLEAKGINEVLMKPVLKAELADAIYNIFSTRKK